MTNTRENRSLISLWAGAAFAACLCGVTFAAEPAAPARSADDIAKARAQRLEALLSANDTVLADIPVIGRRSRATDAILRLSTTRASSCAFNPRDDMGAYYEAMTRNGFGGAASTAPPLVTTLRRSA